MEVTAISFALDDLLFGSKHISLYAANVYYYGGGINGCSWLFWRNESSVIRAN